MEVYREQAGPSFVSFGWACRLSRSFCRLIWGMKNQNLAQIIAAGSLVFLDVMSDLADSNAFASQNSPSLRSVLDKLRQTLSELGKEQDSPPLVILDDISSLEWMGIPVLELSRFCRALCALCRKV